jgi:hypothetical protein
MKQVAKHENILQDVRRVGFQVFFPHVAFSLFQMIKVQHEHEEQWWKGREALIERQKARQEGQKKLEDVLFVHFQRFL